MMSQSIRCYKNCISKYVSPSSLAKLGNRGNDTDEPDDSKAGPKRLRSSTSAVFDFNKHGLFCHDVALCTLPNEYDDNVPHQYRTPASIATTDKMADGVTYKQYLLGLCQKRGDDLGKIVSGRILGAHSDLHAADARYHRKCNAFFHRGTHRICDTDCKSDADDQAFYETINVVSSDRARVWNSIYVEAVYSYKGGCMMARRVLVDKIVPTFW